MVTFEFMEIATRQTRGECLTALSGRNPRPLPPRRQSHRFDMATVIRISTSALLLKIKTLVCNRAQDEFNRKVRLFD